MAEESLTLAFYSEVGSSCLDRTDPDCCSAGVSKYVLMRNYILLFLMIMTRGWQYLNVPNSTISDINLCLKMTLNIQMGQFNLSQKGKLREDAGWNSIILGSNLQQKFSTKYLFDILILHRIFYYANIKLLLNIKQFSIESIFLI